MMKHSQLIELLQALDYPIHEDGVCFGVAAMGMQAILACDVDTFQKRLAAIDKIKLDAASFAAYIKRIEDKRKKKIRLTAQELELSDLHAFLEGIVLYFKPYQFPYLFPKDAVPKVQDIALTLSRGLPRQLVTVNDFQLSKGAVVPELQEIQVTKLDSKEFVGLYTLESLTSYFKLLRPNPPGFKPPVAFVLRSSGHALTVAYDCEKKCWQLIDVDQLPMQEFSDEVDLAKAVLGSFSNNDIAIFHAEVFCRKEQMASAQEWLRKVTNDEAFRALHAGQEKNHAYTDSDGGSLLYIATKANNVELVEKLLGSGAVVDIPTDNGTTPLYIAAQLGYVDIVRTLLKAGADPNKPRNNSSTPLAVAANNGQVDCVKQLLDSNASINYANVCGGTALLRAAKYGHAEVVKTLLDRKAAVNQAANNGATPLCVAAKEGHPEIIEILLANKANTDVFMKLSINKLLETALKSNRKSEVSDLFKTHKILDNSYVDFTPLHAAAYFGHVDVVKKLLLAKADINKKSESGMTCLDVAKAMGRHEIVDILLGNNRKLGTGAMYVGLFGEGSSTTVSEGGALYVPPYALSKSGSSR